MYSDSSQLQYLASYNIKILIVSDIFFEFSIVIKGLSIVFKYKGFSQALKLNDKLEKVFGRSLKSFSVALSINPFPLCNVMSLNTSQFYQILKCLEIENEFNQEMIMVLVDKIGNS
ncbi:hypothetical protein ACTFIU_006979 [Dictyostelium citrinum]